MKSSPVTIDAIKVEIKASEERMKEDFRGYRDDILNKLDEVMGELENHRIERDFVKNDIKNLDERVTKLENSHPQ